MLQALASKRSFMFCFLRLRLRLLFLFLFFFLFLILPLDIPPFPYSIPILVLLLLFRFLPYFLFRLIFVFTVLTTQLHDVLKEMSIGEVQGLVKSDDFWFATACIQVLTLLLICYTNLHGFIFQNIFILR
jgi:hypothetical protein